LREENFTNMSNKSVLNFLKESNTSISKFMLMSKMRKKNEKKIKKKSSK